MPKIFGDEKGKGPFSGMASPLNAQVEGKDPRSGVAKNSAFPVSMPKDPLDFIPGDKE